MILMIMVKMVKTKEITNGITTTREIIGPIMTELMKIQKIILATHPILSLEEAIRMTIP